MNMGTKIIGRGLDAGSSLAGCLFWILLPVAVGGLLVTGFFFFGAILMMFA